VKRGIAALLILAVAAFFWVRPSPVPLPPPTGVIDRIVVEKSARRMVLWQRGRPVRIYSIALGFDPAGDKHHQGDGRTPEGLFHIDRRNDQSAYHLSLGIDYPQPQDRARATAGGYDPGGDIMIHGQPDNLSGVAPLKGDWTAGCMALSNAEIEEVWALTVIGTEVEIRP
jgi:murein L,D-transpeptidase YafK